MNAITNQPPATSRRGLLKGAALTGLTIAFDLALPQRRVSAAAATAAEFAPNAFLVIKPDNSVTVMSKHVELGQGAYTGLATILADELDADWSQIRVESAPADVTRYANFAFKVQGTGGSTAIANSWMQLREAGAMGRAMLIAAAASQWGAPADEITVDRGVVRHPASKREATFGALAERAAGVPPPAKVALKDPKDFKLIGAKQLPRVDVPPKTDGTAQFTIDVVLPGMLVALVKRPPRFGATVASFDAAAAKAIPGVVDVVEIPAGVAVVGKGFWAAKQGRDALKVAWDDSKAEKRSSSAILAEYRRLADQPGLPARVEGGVAGALNSAAKTISATYEFPYLAHAPMEPLDAVVKLDANGCEIWAGDQFQTVDQNNAARVAGLKPEQVKIHTLFAGGSFGRRANGVSD
ncbi:MAG: molybdopterin cofactor-binding domain-containing protein, partial [Roseiarcus sp.]